MRPLLYRASLAGMCVPDGDPGYTPWNKNALNEGEYGMGGMANSLVLGCDCLGEIIYLDGYVCDQDGEPARIERMQSLPMKRMPASGERIRISALVRLRSFASDAW